jgi:ATP-dependent helicase/DNAse subunit B
MSRQIWFGPVLNENRNRLIDMCASRLNAGRADSFLYLAASRPLLDRALSSILVGAENSGTWGTTSVYLFRGFVRRIISKAQTVADRHPLEPRTRIDTDENPIKHTLVSRLLQDLADAGELSTITPLVRREGCASTVERLLGEFQRAVISSTEFQHIVDMRATDRAQPGEKSENDSESDSPHHSQVEFDRDLAAVYKLYAERLETFNLTEDDADQLRALSILRGELNGQEVDVPWLSTVDLLIIDGFYDFTPIQGAILRQIIPRIPNVIVNLNADESNPEIFRPFDETVEMFDSIAKFEVIQSPAFKAPDNALKSLRTRLFNPDIESVVESASADDVESELEPEFASGVRIYNCSDPAVEIRTIAKEIKRLVLNDGYALSEIALVFRQSTNYFELVDRIFEDEGIPCNLGRSQNIGEIAPVRAAIKLFELFTEIGAESALQLRMTSFSSIIKSGYFRFGGKILKSLTWLKGEDKGKSFELELDLKLSPDAFENAIAYVGQDLTAQEWLIRARKLQKKPEEDLTSLPAGEDLSTDEEIGDSFDNAGGQDTAAVQAKVATELEEDSLSLSIKETIRIVAAIEIIARQGKPEELKKQIYQALENLRFIPRIDPEQTEDESKLGVGVSITEARAIAGLDVALESAVRSFNIGFGKVELESPPTVSLGDFVKSVLNCIQGINIEIRASGSRGVPVLAATDVRGLKFRAMFIAGLVEGNFPIRPRHDWIYPHEERARLKKYGLTLEDTSPNSLLKEEHYFYQAACRATERLYLTRPLVSADGNETVESYYINELKHALLPRAVETLTIRPGTDLKDVFQSSTPSELVLAVSQSRKELVTPIDDQLMEPVGNFVDQLSTWIRVEEYQSTDAVRRISVAHQRSTGSFSKFDGRISNERLAQLTRERFDQEHVFSASEFGLYGKCPFKFFAERILKLKPRGEAAADLAAIDSGLMLHEILRRFFEAHRGAFLESSGFESLKVELNQIADLVFDEFEAKVPPITPNVWRLEREFRKILLSNFLLDEIRMQEKVAMTGMRPSYFELGFGFTGEGMDPSSVRDYIELQRPKEQGDSNRILIRGKIDRVDLADDGTLLAYDYKLSNGASREDMEQGRELQLGIYLEALERLFFPEVEIAGGGYYVVVKPSGKRNQGLYRAELSNYTGIGKVQSNLDDGAWYEMRQTMLDRVWQFWDGIRAAHFEVAPTAPNKSCTHCDYRALCRFEPHRIGEKMRASRGDEIDLEQKNW